MHFVLGIHSFINVSRFRWACLMPEPRSGGKEWGEGKERGMERDKLTLFLSLLSERTVALTFPCPPSILFNGGHE